MNIYVIGDPHQGEEIKKKINPEHSVTTLDYFAAHDDNETSVVFDFTIDDSPISLEKYSGLINFSLFINSTRVSLAEFSLLAEPELPNLFGIAGDSTFLERSLIEVSAFSKNRIEAVTLLANLGLKATLVADRVGLVTPRIIAMIINEAYYTVMEGTATREDVDTAMKLGTNYPMGPFEWAKKWGIINIYELLLALYQDTKDERYKISSLLKGEYLNSL